MKVLSVEEMSQVGGAVNATEIAEGVGLAAGTVLAVAALPVVSVGVGIAVSVAALSAGAAGGYLIGNGMS
jgi:hypothetical protein